MLSELRLSAIGVIAQACLELGPGFTAITGETGAGKTMVVTGLSLLLGERADSRLIRTGASQARVEGRLTVASSAETADLDELGAMVEDGELLVVRQVTPKRSAAFIGGAQIPVSRLSSVTGTYVTIHGQSEQQRLGSADHQRDVLDTYAGPQTQELVGKYRHLYRRRSASMAELSRLRGEARERARQRDFLSFGLAEIEKVAPQPHEDEELAQETRKLQAVDDLRVAASEATMALAGDDDAPDLSSAYTLISSAHRVMDRVANRDPEAATLAGRLAETEYLVADIIADLSSYVTGLDVDPRRLEWVGQRRAALQQLTRKYGDSINDVLAWSQQAAASISELDNSDERITALERAVAAADARLQQWGADITRLRNKAATELSDRVHAELAALAMPHARLHFEISPLADPGPHGCDNVVLMFAANPGATAAPLAKVASGGELSRVRLALEVVLAEGQPEHTFVFDEVDAGVGGAVALEIGRRLARLADHAQVIVVTHLAQVAAYADAHFVVSKSTDGQVTSSDIRRVDGLAREEELARLMAGTVSQKALAHARDLLAHAVAERSGRRVHLAAEQTG